MEENIRHHAISEIPLIGAQVFIEPGQTPEEIDTWFRILHENQLPICRIRLFENYMRSPDGAWDFSLFDQAFQTAEKFNIKILGTLFPATSFSDVGGFKFPRSSDHLEEIAVYIQNLVTHFRTSPALFGWVLINEPGARQLPESEFTRKKFKQWHDDQIPPTYQSKGYPHFDFAEERFLVVYNTWYLQWLAAESIHKVPFRFEQHQPGLLSRTLESTSAYVTIVINKNLTPVDLEMVPPNWLPSSCQPTILSSIHNGKINSKTGLHLPPEDTLVVKWPLE